MTLTAQEIIEARDAVMLDAVHRIADTSWRDDGHYVIADYAPDRAEYEDGDSPGSDWDRECERLLTEIRTALPDGWVADWADDDVRIEWQG